MSDVGEVVEACVYALERFMRQSIRSNYIQGPDISMYVRKSSRYINGSLRRGFDIASVSISPKLQNKGMFTRILREFELTLRNKTDMEYLYVECVLVYFLELHLIKNGYVSNNNVYSPSFYKLLR